MRLLDIPSRASFRRQIILAFVVGFFVLIAAFSTYVVWTESRNLHRDTVNETTSMAQSLAAGALPWVLAGDVAGLQEAVHAFRTSPEFVYAMVISPSGQVLAHSDASKVGLFLSDEQSRALFNGPPGTRVMEDSASIIDVAAPIEVDRQRVGWARIGSHNKGNAAILRHMIWNNVLFLALSTMLSLLAAILIADRLGRRIGSLIEVAEGVQAGNFARRVSVHDGTDEIAKLGNSLNKMLDVLSQNEQDLRVASLYTRSLIEASLDPLVTISPEGKITDVNEATENITGMSRTELIGTDFSNYFTEPDKARQGYQEVFLKGSVTDYPLALRHRDGHVTDVLYNASVYRKGAGNVLGVFAAARDVTERKKAELEREQYFKFFNASTDLMGIADPHGAFKKVNPAFMNVLGYSEEEILAKPFIEFVHPDDRQRTLDEIARELKLGFTLDFENRYVCKDGSLRWLSWRANVDEGLTYATGRDVTERKKVEDALVASEKEFHLLAEAMPQIVWIARGDGWHTYFNRQWVDYTGLTLEEGYGHGWNKPFHPDDQQRAWDAWQSAVNSHGTYSLECRLRRFDGTYRWWLIRGVPVLDESGDIAKWFGTCTDIDDLKAAEQRIRESERKFRTLTDTSPLAIYMSSGIEQKAEYINPRFTELFGYTLEEVPSVAEWWPRAYPDEAYRNQVSEEWQRKVERAIQASSSIEPMEVVVTCKDGSKKNISWGYISTGVQNWAFGLDLTERKRAEEEVHRLNAELEERVKERTAELESFSYSVSHDLRVPLRAVDGFSRILLEEYHEKLDDEGKRLVGVVRDNTARMARLIDDILAFSRLGRKEMASQQVDMQALAGDVAAELASSWAERDVKLEIGALPPAYGDAAMLRQVWVNLLSNAIKFTRTKPAARIVVGGHTENEDTIYCVRDNGVGFDMQYAGKLFGVFQRLHDAEEFEGTGAGLAIVKRIITRHSGRVWAESKVDEGAAFYFTLPAREESQGPAKAEEIAPAPAGNQEPAKEKEHG